jgi:hypothetical protein
MRIFIWFMLIISFAGCVKKEIQITPLETESWIDLMPVTPGYTYIQMKFAITGENADKAEVTAANVSWDQGSYLLKKNEIETSITSFEENLAELSFRAVFLLKEKDVNKFDVEIEFSFGTDKMRRNFEDIKVEKVY